MYAKVITTKRIKAIVEAKIRDLERRMEMTKYIWDTDTLFINYLVRSYSHLM
jgi:hypothetical protein